jgi:hypothetical protein
VSKETQKGTTFESMCARYLADCLGEPIERRAKCGSADRGDLAGIYLHGKRVVAECKNCARTELAKWVREAEVERVNDNASYGVVFHKRRGFGERNMGGTYVTMTLRDFAEILKENRL